ncbi:hypothetical protein F4777DRAFT_587463 [Nemania sp. FL0916]|nr:hypothetical protein F4777DRAFT_587463 [Nemania sp. FL0916]
MAPSKAEPKPARSGSGQTKKQPTAPATATAVTASTPVGRQQVVPAIPLPYMNKQSNGTRNAAVRPSSKHAPTASTSSNGFPVSSLEAALITRDPLHSVKSAESEVKGRGVEKLTPASVAVSIPGSGQEPQLDPLQMNGDRHTSTEAIGGPSDGSEATGATQGELRHYSVAPQILDEAPRRLHVSGTNRDSLYISQPQSATSATKPEFAVPIPAHSHQFQHQQHVTDQHHHAAAFHAPLPHHMHPHQHRHQISNGAGIMFGGFDSHTPSPAPLPGGFMPPPPPPMNGESRVHPRPNGHHHPSHSNNNGFPAPINTHFRSDVVMPAADMYGTGPAPTPPLHVEAYGPGAGRYGPPTPHSFHGSHTSGERNGIENITLPYPPNGSFPHTRREYPLGPHHPPGPFPPFIPLQPISPQFNMAEDEMMDGVHYIRNLFDKEELSDCVLELKYTKDRHHPVKIRGHKLILARSPALQRHILYARARDPGFHTITMEVDDPYLHWDSWWVAVQHLYQHPLFTPPMLGNGMDVAGNKTEQFAFCLGYAAAGHTLAMRNILVRGLQVAADLLTWDNVEVGLGFVLENTIHEHLDHNGELEEALLPTILKFGYGPETKILLSAILNFLVTEFPSNFQLDTAVADTPQIARMPISAAAAAAAAATTPTRARTSDKIIPAIARGTTTRLPSKQTRLSSIKFGDLPAAYPDDGGVPHREPAKCSAALSRILLNLPFDELCQVLTSGSNGVSGWNTAQDRYHVAAETVAEREVRRLLAVEAVRSGAIPDAHKIQLRLSAPQRYRNVEQWDVLNWQEEVIRVETPRIVRRWVPQFDVAQQPTEQPGTPTYDIPDSMV